MATTASAALHEHDGITLAGLVRKGELHPRELVEAVIERIEALNPKLGCVVAPMFDEARRVAGEPLPAGPLAGVPFLLQRRRCGTMPAIPLGTIMSGPEHLHRASLLANRRAASRFHLGAAR